MTDRDKANDMIESKDLYDKVMSLTGLDLIDFLESDTSMPVAEIELCKCYMECFGDEDFVAQDSVDEMTARLEAAYVSSPGDPDISRYKRWRLERDMGI